MEKDLLFSVAQKVVGKVGNDFLLALVEHLGEAMDVTWVFIAEGVGVPPTHARIRYSIRDGAESKPITYELEGTPCKNLYAGKSELFYIPNGLCDKFPKEVGFESYCGAPLHDTEGRITGNIAVISDQPIKDLDKTQDVIRLFSMRVEAELHRIEYETSLENTVSRLERQRDMLNKVNGFKSDLLAMIGHDLRNPLQALVSSGELIKSYIHATGDALEGKGSRIEKSCDVILRTTDRMEKMIALMMKNGRANATEFEAHCTNVQLQGSAKIALNLREEAATAKNIRLNVSIDPNHRAWADEDLLIEALDNLIGNAIKFSPNGTSVNLTSRLAGDQVELQVIDEGAGILPDETSHIFEPYQTASARPTGGETSTGLGLAIVRSIADAHHGTISVASNGRGQGCTFTLGLPQTSGHAAA